MPTRRILQMHEFKCNTFAERMIAVFADGHDEMQFEDFLDMASGACVCCVWMGLSPPSSPAVISCDAFPRTRCSPLMGGVTTPAPTFSAAHGVSLVPSSRVVSDTGQYRFFFGFVGCTQWCSVFGACYKGCQGFLRLSNLRL